jgi:hypothetical protein
MLQRIVAAARATGRRGGAADQIAVETPYDLCENAIEG